MEKIDLTTQSHTSAIRERMWKHGVKLTTRSHSAATRDAQREMVRIEMDMTSGSACQRGNPNAQARPLDNVWAPTASKTRGCGCIWAARSVEEVGPREAIWPRSAVPPFSLFFLFHFLFYLFYFQISISNSNLILSFKHTSDASKVLAWVAIVLYTFYANYVIHLCICFQIYSS